MSPARAPASRKSCADSAPAPSRPSRARQKDHDSRGALIFSAAGSGAYGEKTAHRGCRPTRFPAEKRIFTGFAAFLGVFGPEKAAKPP
jgi:hypothetical protein